MDIPSTPGVGETGLRASPSDAQRRLRFLNEATIRIGASLDLDQIAHEFGRVSVPALADAITIHLLEVLLSDDIERELPDPDSVPYAAVRRVVTVPPAGSPPWTGPAEPDAPARRLAAESPGRRAMTSRAPVLIQRVDAELARLLRGVCPGAEFAPSYEGFALLALPLMVRGRLLGCAMLLRRPERGPFSEVDVLTACQLAAQTSLGVDNARLLRGEATIADALQRSMLPTEPAQLAGIEIAHRYLPGSRAAQVGGDWFDALPLPGGRVALVVGDVMGHGISSAAMMGQLRTAVRTLTALDLPPDQVLRQLDDLAERLGERYLATCVYAVYDPVARRCSIANAGHIPPVLVRGDGGAELVDLPAGAPIGIGGVAFETVEIEAADQDLLVLCTDGLVEVRGQDIGLGLAALCENLTSPGRSLDRLCDDLLRAVHPGERQDDVALLVARMHGIASEDVAQWLLAAGPTTPARARTLARRTLHAWGLSGIAHVVELLVSELVTNAVRYASRPIELRLMRIDVLLCEVTDDDHRLPTLCRAGATDEGGRGLYLVSQYASHWGTSRSANGKVVWFTLPLTSGPGRDQPDPND
jgi:anti-sigma regulatory factor (Ser/Thr protein kinase)